MTREPAKSPAASIRARLLTLAQSKGQDYQRVLGRYTIERFLYRLAEQWIENQGHRILDRMTWHEPLDSWSL